MKLQIKVVLLFSVAVATSVTAQEDQHQKIEEKMKDLAPLVGTWSATWKFHRGGEIIERVGTDVISFVLDNTYLEWKVERHPREDPARSQSMLILTTFQPRNDKYNTTCF